MRPLTQGSLKKYVSDMQIGDYIAATFVAAENGKSKFEYTEIGDIDLSLPEYDYNSLAYVENSAGSEFVDTKGLVYLIKTQPGLLIPTTFAFAENYQLEQRTRICICNSMNYFNGALKTLRTKNKNNEESSINVRVRVPTAKEISNAINGNLNYTTYGNNSNIFYSDESMPRTEIVQPHWAGIDEEEGFYYNYSYYADTSQTSFFGTGYFDPNEDAGFRFVIEFIDNPDSIDFYH